MQSHAQKPSHESVASFLVKVGDFSYASHDYLQAEHSYRAALSEYLRAGGLSVDVASTMMRLSDSCFMQGNLTEAKELKEQAELMLERQRSEMERFYLLPAYVPPAAGSKAPGAEAFRSVLESLLFLFYCAAISVAILSTPLLNFSVPILHSSFGSLR